MPKGIPNKSAERLLFERILSSNILTAIKASNLSQKDVADELGISSSVISNWKQGKTDFPIWLIFKLCRILDVKPKDIIPSGLIK